MNFAKVHALILRGFAETVAKKASVGWPEHSLDHIAALWRRYRTDIEALEVWQQLDIEVANWPSVADIVALSREGLDPTVALQVLHRASGKSVAELREEFRASRMQAAAAAQPAFPTGLAPLQVRWLNSTPSSNSL